MFLSTPRAPRSAAWIAALLMLAAFFACASTASAKASKTKTVTGTYSVAVAEKLGKNPGHERGVPVLTTTKFQYKLRLNATSTRVRHNGRTYSWKRGKKFFSQRASVTVTGKLRGNTLTVTKIRLAKPSKKGKAAGYSGTYRTAVILYNFTDITTQPYTVEGIRNDVFTGPDSVQAYWREASHDILKLSGTNTSNLNGDVFPWVTIPVAAGTTCDYTNWGNAAITASGVNPANYDRIMFVSPLPSGCSSWGGVADMNSRLWFFQPQPGSSNPNARVMAHEFGHDFDLSHSGAAPCPVTGTSLEVTATSTTGCYDQGTFGNWAIADKFNLMGSSNTSMNHINAVQKITTGIMPLSASAAMSTPGTYTLYPQELASAPGPQLLKAPRPNYPMTGIANPTMYAEYRQPYGVFDLFNNANDSQIPAGVNFMYGPGINLNAKGETQSGNGWEVMQLDGEPDGTDVFSLDFDSMRPSHSFYDYASGLVYSVLSANGTSAQVETRTPPVAGNYPTISVSGTKIIYNAGTNQHNSVYVKKNSAGNAYLITDNATPVTAGAGCTAYGEMTVSCPYSGITEINANLGDLGDSFQTIGNVYTRTIVDGGTGTDYISGITTVASYATRTAPVNVSLDGVANDGEAGENDYLDQGVTGVIGGSGNDTLTGSANETDWFDGGLGTDLIDGGAGEQDEASYATRTADLTIRLNNQAVSGNPAISENDTLRNIERAEGGSGNDTMSGSTTYFGYSGLIDSNGGNDTVTPGASHYMTAHLGSGNDTYTGTANQDIIYLEDGDDKIDTGTGTQYDYVDGGFGSDTVDYSTRTANLNIDLVNGGTSGSESDSFGSVENAIGGSGNDTITGDSGANVLNGGGGSDTFNSGAGSDLILARDGLTDVIDCGADSDSARIDSADTSVTACEDATQGPQTTIDSGIADNGSSTGTTQTFTFSSDTPGATFECSLESGAYTACTSPYTTPTLGLGAHDFAVRAKDAFGADPSPATRHYTIISPAPDTAIDAGPLSGAVLDEATATYAFHGIPSAASYECNVDGGAWTACTSPYTTPTLTVGAHTFNVRAVGSGSSGPDPSPASRTLTVLFPQVVNKPAPASIPSTVPLSTDATLGAAIDWIHWKGTANTQFDRKNTTQQISTWSAVGGSSLGTRSDSPNYTWTDAVGTASGSSKVGVTNGGAAARGFKITVPASNTQTRTLKLYVGMSGYNIAGKLSVYFNGQTAVTDTTVSGGLLSPTLRVFTITYRPSAATDTLNVEWVQNSSSSSARAILYSAGLYNAQTPDTTISSGPAQGATITTSTASIGFTSSVSGSTFQCKLDQAAWVACASAWTTPTLTTGLHTVRVRATSANGSVDQTPAVRSFYKS